MLEQQLGDDPQEIRPAPSRRAEECPPAREDVVSHVIIGQERTAAAAGQPLPPPETQHRERALSTGGAALDQGAGRLGRVLDHNGAGRRRNAIHLGEVNGIPVQVHDDDRRRALIQGRAQLCEVRRECVRVDVIKEDRDARALRRRCQVVTRVRRQRDRGAGPIPNGTAQRRGQRRGTGFGEEHGQRAVPLLQELDYVLLGPSRPAIACDSRPRAGEQRRQRERRGDGNLVSPGAQSALPLTGGSGPAEGQADSRSTAVTNATRAAPTRMQGRRARAWRCGRVVRIGTTAAAHRCRPTAA